MSTSKVDSKKRIVLPNGRPGEIFDIQQQAEGRYLYFEAPAPHGLPGEDAPRGVFEIEGLEVHVIGVEDLLLDRVRAWIHWRSGEDERWSRRLAGLYADRIDWAYLSSRTETDAERRALETLREGTPEESRNE